MLYHGVAVGSSAVPGTGFKHDQLCHADITTHMLYSLVRLPKLGGWLHIGPLKTKWSKSESEENRAIRIFLEILGYYCMEASLINILKFGEYAIIQNVSFCKFNNHVLIQKHAQIQL